MQIKDYMYFKPDTVGEYCIPQIKPVYNIDKVEFCGLNYAKSIKNKSDYGLHFYLDDYQFERVYNNPILYTKIIKQFKMVLSPDFSMFSDYPKAIQIYNHYRKHWLAAYWQTFGITVIPTISWSDENSFSWCFDGEPYNSIVSISSVGTQNNAVSKKNFLNGYEQMLKKLNPTTILFYGNIPKEINDNNIIQLNAYQNKFRKGK